MPFTNYARDKFMAPELSLFTGAEIPDLERVSVEQDHWLGNFILNTALRARVQQPQRALMFNFLRRVGGAHSEYQAARAQTLEYLSAIGSCSSPTPGRRTRSSNA